MTNETAVPIMVQLDAQEISAGVTEMDKLAQILQSTPQWATMEAKRNEEWSICFARIVGKRLKRIWRFALSAGTRCPGSPSWKPYGRWACPALSAGEINYQETTAPTVAVCWQ